MTQSKRIHLEKWEVKELVEKAIQAVYGERWKVTVLTADDNGLHAIIETVAKANEKGAL